VIASSPCNNLAGSNVTTEMVWRANILLNSERL
jgi:hypothetical protein